MSKHDSHTNQRSTNGANLMIVVTARTGLVGHQVLENLLDRDEPAARSHETPIASQPASGSASR